MTIWYWILPLPILIFFGVLWFLRQWVWDYRISQTNERTKERYFRARQQEEARWVFQENLSLAKDNWKAKAIPNDKPVSEDERCSLWYAFVAYYGYETMKKVRECFSPQKPSSNSRSYVKPLNAEDLPSIPYK